MSLTHLARILICCLLLPALAACRKTPSAAEFSAGAPDSLQLRNFCLDGGTLRDISYVPGSHNPAQTLDLYLPPDAGKLRPLIIWIHGGAWVEGNKADCPPSLFLPSGFAAASINYRLSSEAPFPAQINDCKAAVRFLRASASRWGIDQNRIGVWGSSAGGHLCALVGTTGDLSNLEGDGGNLQVSSRVQAVCDWCGPSNLVSAPSQCLPGNRISFSGKDSPVYPFMGGHMDSGSLAAASPVTYVGAGEPPFLIMHGGKDDVVPEAQSEELYKCLRAAGNDVRLYVVKDAGHAFFAPEQLKMVLQFFKRTLSN